MSEAIKWLGPPQFTDFGRVAPGDIVWFNRYPALTDLSLAAAKWVEQGMAEWYVEPPTSLGQAITSTTIHITWDDTQASKTVSKKTKIKGGHNG